MDLTKARDNKGIMTAIDFEKAFDSVNWNFFIEITGIFWLWRVLQGMD